MLVLIMFFLHAVQEGRPSAGRRTPSDTLPAPGCCSVSATPLRAHPESGSAVGVFPRIGLDLSVVLLLVTATGVLQHILHRTGTDMAANIAYVVHLALVVPMLTLEVPFSKWSHLAYRPLAMYLAVKATAMARAPRNCGAPVPNRRRSSKWHEGVKPWQSQDRRLRLQLRHEHLSHGGRGVDHRNRGQAPGCDHCPLLPLHVLQSRAGDDHQGHQGTRPGASRGVRVQPAHARTDLSQRLQVGRHQSLLLRNGEYPGTMQLGACRPVAATEKARTWARAVCRVALPRTARSPDCGDVPEHAGAGRRDRGPDRGTGVGLAGHPVYLVEKSDRWAATWHVST